MGNINVRVPDNIEISLKKSAELNDMTLSEYVRSMLTGEAKPNELSRVTVEARLEKLEESKKAMTDFMRRTYNNMQYNAEFNRIFLSNSMKLLMQDAGMVADAWNQTVQEMEERRSKKR